MTVFASVALVARVPTEGAEVTQEHVDAAVARGRAWLLARQQAPGRWEPDARRQGNKHDPEGMQGSTWGGYTALATYALLASGMSAQGKELAPAIEFLKTADITGPYAVGVRAQVWSLLPRGAETRRLLKQDSDILLAALNTRGRAAGLWDYQDPSPNGNNIDHSASQFGVLGLWAAAQGGVEFNAKLWGAFDSVWKKHQFANGGWSYDTVANDAHGQVTHTMTAAGVATLFITQEYLAANKGLNCTGASADEHLERGMRWLTDNFKVLDNAYYWYGIERIGAASGRKYFGGKDWYATAVAELLRSQDSDGSWNTRSAGGPSQFPDTCFALLVLTRGRAPIVMNKLEYVTPGATGAAAAGDWNQRPRDAANVTRWMGVQGERYLNWQVVNLSGNPQDLLDAPILYISGSRRLAFGADDLAKLRQFVEDGGLILGNANCGKEEFAKSFRQLGAALFPTYEFRELQPNHPILAGQNFRADRWKTTVGLEGLTNGTRELMLLLPAADAGRAWQQRADRTRESAFQIAANIYFYATDRSWGGLKGQTHVVRNADATAAAATTIKVARLQVGPNWNPEPGGWRRLSAVMRKEQKVAVDVTVIKLGTGTLSQASAQVAHLTGTVPLTLDRAQREELKQFVTAGGTLVIDAAGGSTAFAESAEGELAAVFGHGATDQLIEPIPPGDAMYAIPSAPIKRVAYRRTAVEKLTGDLKAPRLRGIRFGGRLGVIVSREDLSTGLVGHAVDGVVGYDPVSATALMRNILLYAAGSAAVRR
jgi:hypothetical protein